MSIMKLGNTGQFNSQRGFSLFELLIALLVLSIGLIGLATLQAQGIRSNYSASSRSEATFLAIDIADRMRSNMRNTLTLDENLTALANNYTIDTNADDRYDPTSTTDVATQCANVNLSITNACEWEAAIENLLPVGRGLVTRTGGVFLITLMWDDERTGNTGTGCSGGNADLTCFHTIFQP